MNGLLAMHQAACSTTPGSQCAEVYPHAAFHGSLQPAVYDLCVCRSVQAGKIIDTRVLLPDVELQRDFEGPPEKGPSRVDEDAVGGEHEAVERGLDPQDLAWRSMGPHWMTSVFDGGNVWLVDTAAMGPTQRELLGLAPSLSADSSVLQEPGLQQQPGGAAGGGSDDDSDDDDDSLDEESR